MSGWIKLHRKIMDNPIVCKDGDYLAVWVYLLLNATHKEHPALFKGKRITLQPGQLITGRKSISEQLGVSESKVKRILIDFENDQQIGRQRSNRNSLITILNWDKYQMIDQQDDQQTTNKRPASDQQVTTNKNDKNDNNINYIYIADFESKFESFWSKYPKKQGKAKAKQKMLTYHKQGLNWDEVMNGLDAYITFVEKERARGFDRQFMDGSTFVNGRRWEDDWTIEKEEIPYKPTHKKMAPLELVRLSKEDEAWFESIYRKRGII